MHALVFCLFVVLFFSFVCLEFFPLVLLLFLLLLFLFLFVCLFVCFGSSPERSTCVCSGNLSALAFLLVLVWKALHVLFRYPFHHYVTAVARTDPGHSAQSAGCRLQLNTRYLCGFEGSDTVKWCMMYTELAPRRDGNGFKWHHPCNNQTTLSVYTTSVDIWGGGGGGGEKKKKSAIKGYSRSFRITYDISAVSLPESYINMIYLFLPSSFFLFLIFDFYS